MIDALWAQTPTPSLNADLVLGFVLLDLLIIVAAARLVGGLFIRIGQPRVAGEILAGVLLGPTLLGSTVYTWADPPAFLHCDQALAATAATPSITSCLFPPQARSVLAVVGQLSLALFMFLVGLGLDFAMTKGKGRAITTIAMGSVAVPVGAGLLIGRWLYESDWVGGFGTPSQPSPVAFSLMVGAILSVTAFPVMARILQEKELIQTAMGSVGVAAAANITVLMFLVVAAARGAASGSGPAALAVKFAVTAFYLAAMFWGARPLLRRLGARYEVTGAVSGGMFATVLMTVLLSAYVADRLGLTVIVGGFLAGAVMPERKAWLDEFQARLGDLTIIVLLPVFLAFSGLNTDFTKLRFSHLGGVGLFLVAGVVGKWLGGAVSARMGGLSWAESNLIGILVNCRGLLVLVVALIALNDGVITAPLQVGAVLMALITTMMTGPLFDRFWRHPEGSDHLARDSTQAG